MSLEEEEKRLVMLGIDCRNAGSRAVESGTDPGVASDEVGFKGLEREEIYGWVNQTLREQGYSELKRDARGLIRCYLGKMTGLSRAQIPRLITVYLSGEEVKATPYRRHRFRNAIPARM